MLLPVSNLINKIKQDAYLLIFVASSLAIIAAYVAEFVFHLTPCILCLYQRIPYFLLIIFSLITLLASITRQYLRFVISLLTMVEITLASYHVGVERYIFEDSHVCQVQNGLNSTIQEMLSAGKIASTCSEVSFRFMNFSMVEWNLLYAVFLFYWFSRTFRQ